MKKLFVLLFLTCLLFAGAVFANPVLKWNIEYGEPDGFILHYKALGDATYQTINITPGTLREYDISQLGLVGGTRYELFLVSTKDGSQSGPSDILRYTYPREQQVIELPATQPINIQINIGVNP